MISKHQVYVYIIVTLVCVTLAYITMMQDIVYRQKMQAERLKPTLSLNATQNGNAEVHIYDDVHRLLHLYHLGLIKLMDNDLDLKKDVILPLQQLPPIEHYSSDSNQSHGRAVDYVGYRKFRRLLGFMGNVLERYNITYTLSDGSLLGSYLYHDMLPWDENIDIRVAYRDYATLKKVVYQDLNIRNYVSIHGWEGSDYNNEGDEDQEQLNDKWTFVNEQKSSKYPNGWPYINIRLMRENSTHIWTHERNPIYFSLNEYYPLHLRPFMSMWQPSPHDTRLYLKKKFMTFHCMSKKLDTQPESGAQFETTDCSSSVNSIYPRVRRSRHREGTLEQLRVRSAALYTAYVHEPFTGMGTEYSVD